jgi:hypothetical protein
MTYKDEQSRMELVFDNGRGEQLLNALYNQREFIRSQMRAIAREKDRDESWNVAFYLDIGNITRMTHMINEIRLQFAQSYIA